MRQQIPIEHNKDVPTSTNKEEQGGIDKPQQSIKRERQQATIEDNKGAPKDTNTTQHNKEAMQQERKVRKIKIMNKVKISSTPKTH